MKLKIHIAQHVPSRRAMAEQIDRGIAIVAAIATGVREPADPARPICQ